jgi:hypothetical protein
MASVLFSVEPYTAPPEQPGRQAAMRRAEVCRFFKMWVSVSRLALLIALLFPCCVVAGCGGDLRQHSLGSLGVKDATRISTGGARPSAQETPFRFFSPSSFWNEALPADAPLDPRSAALVGAFDEEVAREEQFDQAPYINTTAYSVPIYTVPVNEPTVRVTLDHTEPPPALQSAWDAVPLPSDAQPAVGTDGHLVVWQPSTNRLWEFWRISHTARGWQAEWGGAMRNVSSDAGVYSKRAWPGAKTGWGASASSLSIAGGLITLEDLEMGQINHALSVAIPNVAGGIYASPAQRTDGTSTAPLSLPEGAHLRLDPSLDLASLHLPRLTLMIAEAAQRYGIIVRDDAPSTISFFAQDPIPTGTNPYSGPSGFFEGKLPNQLLASFPWNHLQLLKMSLHSTSSRPRRRQDADSDG